MVDLELIEGGEPQPRHGNRGGALLPGKNHDDMWFLHWVSAYRLRILGVLLLVAGIISLVFA